MKNIDFSKASIAVLFFSGAISFLHEYGFWKVFKINIFPFLTLSQMIMGSAGFIIFSVFGMVATLVLSAWSIARKRTQSQRYIKIKENLTTALILIGSAAANILSYLYNPDLLPLVSAATVPYFVADFLVNSRFINEQVQINPKIIFPSFLAVSLLFSAFCWGQYEALIIKSGEKYHAVGGKSCDDRYLGLAGDYFIFYDPKSSSIIYRLRKDIKELEVSALRTGSCQKKIK